MLNELHVYCSRSNLIPSSLPVICPYPDNNRSVSQHYNSDNNTDAALFDHWWNKTNTIPLYLIALLLPLLNFRSAAFFARFTFLGKAFFSFMTMICVSILFHFALMCWKSKSRFIWIFGFGRIIKCICCFMVIDFEYLVKRVLCAAFVYYGKSICIFL